MIKAIILDMGGVVMIGKGEEVYKALAEKLGVPKSKFDNSYDRASYENLQRGKVSMDSVLSKMSAKLNVDKEKLRRYWEEAYEEQLSPNKDSLKLVEQLKKNGYVVGVITNAIELHSSTTKMKNLYKLFSPVLVSNEIGLRKPEEEIYRKILELLKFRPEECVFVDDREEHLVPAKKLGMMTILCKNTAQLKQDLKKLGIKI